MSLMKKIATAGAVAAMGLGLGAASASAVTYDLTGGSYEGIATEDHTFTVGGAYTITCDTHGGNPTTFTGDTESPGGPSTNFTPDYSDCDFFGFPASVTINSPWLLTVTGNTSTSNFTGEINIPDNAGHEVIIKVPLVGCEVYVNGSQTFKDGVGGTSLSGDEVGSDFELNAEVNGIIYTTNGSCPFGSGSDGVYQTNGAVTIEGVGVTIIP